MAVAYAVMQCSLLLYLYGFFGYFCASETNDIRQQTKIQVCMSKASWIWKHMTKVDSNNSRCNICQKDVSSSGNTTNLIAHMKRNHLSIYNENEASKKRKAEELSKDNTENQNSNVETRASSSSHSNDMNVRPVLQSKSKQPRVDETFAVHQSYKGGSKAVECNGKLVYMIAKDNMPFTTVEKEGFREFVKSLNSAYQIPSRKKVTQLTEEKYKYLSNKTKDILKNVKSLSMTSDLWTDTMNNIGYIGITVHFQNNNQCESITIGVKAVDDRHTADNLRKWLLEIIDEWSIKKDCIEAVITDGAANIVKAVHDGFGQEKHIHCFAHMLNLVPHKIIYKDNIVKPVINKVKDIVTFFHKSTVAADILRTNTSYKLIQSVETRWNSTYDMLIRFIELSDYVTLALSKCPSSPPSLTCSEMEIVQEFIQVLEPFKDATESICGESYVTLSKTIPALNILKKKIDEFSPTTNTAEYLKKQIVEQFNKRFSQVESMTLPAIATLLDPRFKKIHFRDKLACARAVDKISKEITKEVSTNVDNNQRIRISQETKKDFWSYHSELAEQENQAIESNLEGAISNELKLYLQQPIIAMNENPISYWNQYGNSPLAQLARRYLPIVATSVPSERLFSLTGNILTQDRSRLSSEHLDQLLFLASVKKSQWFS